MKPIQTPNPQNSAGDDSVELPTADNFMDRLGVAGADFILWVFLAIMVLLILLSTGCSGSSEEANVAGTQPAPTVASKPTPKTNSVATDKTLTSQSPATPATDSDNPAATPERVCKHFMERLQQGDRIGAENLLTRSALGITTRANLRLEPVGGPLARYTIKPARYATTQHKLAQVDCTIIDNVDGSTHESEITWLARRQQSGWRISGIMVEFESGSGKDLLSFESIDDVSTIKMLASGDAVDESGKPRQANVVDDQTTLQ